MNETRSWRGMNGHGKGNGRRLALVGGVGVLEGQKFQDE